MPRVFISYQRDDQEFAFRLHEQLTAWGYEAWLDVLNIPKGADWATEIDSGLQSAEVVIAVFTPESMESTNCRNEWNWAIENAKVLIPLRLRETQIRHRYVSLNYIDFAANQQEGFRQLAAALQAPAGAIPPAATSRAAPKDEPPTLIVSRLGRGDYRSISEAVEAAPMGARLLVKPGLYAESVVINKPLEIIGDGPREEILVEHAQWVCLQMKTSSARVRGLTLMGRHETHYAVSIPGGQLVLEDCDISAEGEACLGIHGSMSRPIVRRCRVFGGKIGIQAYRAAEGLIDGCEIYDMEQSGVHITTGANSTLRGCHIYDTGGHGLSIWDTSAATIDDCTIHDAGNSGIDILRGCTATIRKSAIHHNAQNGVYSFGKVRMTGCEIHHNKWHGVAAAEGEATIRGCPINLNQYYGISIGEGVTAAVEDCDLTGNDEGAWDIDDSARVTRRNNKE